MYQWFLGSITATGLLGCITFVIRYAILSGGAWRHTEAGRFMMIVYANMGALFSSVLANLIFGDWPGRRIVTLSLFMAFVIFAWWPLRLLTRARKLTLSKKDLVAETIRGQYDD